MLKIISLIAIILTSSQFIPQTIKAFKTKSVKDVSIITFIITLLASSLWVIHGYAHNDLSIIVANTIVFISSIIMLYFKFKY